MTYSNNVNAGAAAANAAYSGDTNHAGQQRLEDVRDRANRDDDGRQLPRERRATPVPALTPCTATVTSADGLNQSLTVTYSNNVNAGTATANAAFSGDSNHTASNDSETFTIKPIATSTVVTCPASVCLTPVRRARRARQR